MSLPLAALLLALSWSVPVLAQAPFEQGRVLVEASDVLPHRDRIAPYNAVLEHRLDTLLPRLMRETGVDLWLVINREYNEDPVFFSLAPKPVFAARRTTMILFHDDGQEVKRYTVNRYPFPLYEPAWEGGDLDEQWSGLGDLIGELDPQTIAINTSRHWPVADGLSAGLKDRLMEVLSPELQQRITSAERLVVRWLETRTEPEVDLYPQIVSIARGVIAEAFSERVITPEPRRPRTFSGTSRSDSKTWASTSGSILPSTRREPGRSATRRRRSAGRADRS